MTLKDIWEKTKSILPFKNKVEKVIDDVIPKAQSHTFTFKVKSKKIDLAKDIERIVVLNPWIVVGSKPVILINEIENEEKQVEVKFKALSKAKANLVELQIQQFLEKL